MTYQNFNKINATSPDKGNLEMEVNVNEIIMEFRRLVEEGLTSGRKHLWGEALELYNIQTPEVQEVIRRKCELDYRALQFSGI